MKSWKKNPDKKDQREIENIKKKIQIYQMNF